MTYRTPPTTTPHVGETIEVLVTKLELGSGGGYIDDAAVAVTVIAPSGDDPDATTPDPGTDGDGVPCYRSVFVPTVAGEHVVLTEAEKDGMVFRHRQIVRVQPW
jgi:hypothetical protein